MTAPYAEVDLTAAPTLLVAWRRGRNAEGRCVKAGSEVIAALTSYAQDAMTTVQSGGGRLYDPDDEQDNECSFLTTNRGELLDTALLKQIERGASLEQISSDELRRRPIALYALVIGEDVERRISFVHNRSPVQLARKGLVGGIFDDTLTRIESPILAFDRYFDVIIGPSDVFILNQKGFEALFKESEAVLAKTNEWVEQLSECLPLADGSKEWLSGRLRSNSLLRRKVLSVLKRPYVTKLSMDVLRQKMSERNLDATELIVDGQVVLNGDVKGAEKDLLQLLNEDLWTGDFSGEQYAASRKSRRSG